MSNQSKKLARELLEFYLLGRPHSTACGCYSCELWNEIEMTPEDVFTELKAEIEKEES